MWFMVCYVIFFSVFLGLVQLSLHPIAQWWNIPISTQKVIGSTPVGELYFRFPSMPAPLTEKNKSIVLYLVTKHFIQTLHFIGSNGGGDLGSNDWHQHQSHDHPQWSINSRQRWSWDLVAIATNEIKCKKNVKMIPLNFAFSRHIISDTLARSYRTFNAALPWELVPLSDFKMMTPYFSFTYSKDTTSMICPAL